MNDFKYTLKEMEEATLSPEERIEMRSNLRAFMAEHPVRRTFLEQLFVKRPSTVPGVTFMQPALAGFLIVLLVGSGTSFAAADALPGDLLYPIKIGINEPTLGALAISNEDKAKWHATLAGRRLEEAGTLALEGRLSSDARAIIEDNFEKQTERFEADTVALAQAEGMIETAADAQSHMEVSLKAHADVLQELTTTAPEVDVELASILEKVRLSATAVESARVATEGVISAKIGGGIAEAAKAKKRVAEREVNREERTRSGKSASSQARAQADPTLAGESAMTLTMSATIAEDVASTSLEVKIQANEEQDEAREALREGSEKLEEGKHGEAFTAFQKALRTVEKEKIDIDVRKRLKIDGGSFLGEKNWKSWEQEE